MDWKKQPKIVKDTIENSISTFVQTWNKTFSQTTWKTFGNDNSCKSRRAKPDRRQVRSSQNSIRSESYQSKT